MKAEEYFKKYGDRVGLAYKTPVVQRHLIKYDQDTGVYTVFSDALEKTTFTKEEFFARMSLSKLKIMAILLRRYGLNMMKMYH